MGATATRVGSHRRGIVEHSATFRSFAQNMRQRSLRQSARREHPCADRVEALPCQSAFSRFNQPRSARAAQCDDCARDACRFRAAGCRRRFALRHDELLLWRTRQRRKLRLPGLSRRASRRHRPSQPAGHGNPSRRAKVACAHDEQVWAQRQHYRVGQRCPSSNQRAAAGPTSANYDPARCSTGLPVVVAIAGVT